MFKLIIKINIFKDTIIKKYEVQDLKELNICFLIVN